MALLIGALILALEVRSPQREVVAQQLHDEGGVFVAVLGQGVELGNGLVERGLSTRR